MIYRREGTFEIYEQNPRFLIHVSIDFLFFLFLYKVLREVRDIEFSAHSLLEACLELWYSVIMGFDFSFDPIQHHTVQQFP